MQIKDAYRQSDVWINLNGVSQTLSCLNFIDWFIDWLVIDANLFLLRSTMVHHMTPTLVTPTPREWLTC